MTTELKTAIEEKLLSVGPLADAQSYAVAIIESAACQHNHGKPRIADSELRDMLREYAPGVFLWVRKPGAFEAPCRIVSSCHPVGYPDLIAT